MCAVSRNCPLLGRNNEAGAAAMAQAQPFGLGMPLINNIVTFYIIVVQTTASCAPTPVVKNERVNFLPRWKGGNSCAKEASIRILPSCDCASAILLPPRRPPVQRCTSSGLSLQSKDLQRPLSSVNHGKRGGPKIYPNGTLRSRGFSGSGDKFCERHFAILPKGFLESKRFIQN